MNWLEPLNWPVPSLALWLVAAAVVNGRRSFRLPNALTLPAIALGWLLGLLHTLQIRVDAGSGSLLDALAGTFVGLVILGMLYLQGYIGAGNVKLQMGFSTIACCFFGLMDGVVLSAWMIGPTMVVALLVLAYDRLRKPRMLQFPLGIPQAVAGLVALIWWTK